MEISSNGLHPDRLVPIIKKHPNIKVRFSVEGDQITSDTIRGEKDGYDTKVAGLRMLKEAGGTDLGFAMVIQDENVDQLVSVYEFAKGRDLNWRRPRFTMHGNFTRTTTIFTTARRWREKLRGSLQRNSAVPSQRTGFGPISISGLIEKILGHDRLIPCTAGKDFAFIDPWSDVWACNVRSDLPMGNLARQSWDEIITAKWHRGRGKRWLAVSRIAGWSRLPVPPCVRT